MIMITGYSFLTTASIEITQLMTGRGFFEVTDIVTNLMGGIMGGILACIVIPFIRYIYRKTTKSVDTVQERHG